MTVSNSLSSLPVLTVLLYGFIWYLNANLFKRGLINLAERHSVSMLMLVLLGWGFYIGYQADKGALIRPDFQALLPGYWMPFVPVLITLCMLGLYSPLRTALIRLVDHTNSHWLSGIHILRVLAVGSLIKASAGIFPQEFAWYVGIPDLIFGLSAIPVTLLALNDRLGSRFLAGWHLMGALVILVPTFGLMHIHMTSPLYYKLFEYPMALAPMLVVPTFVMLNLMAASYHMVRVFKQRELQDQVVQGPDST